MISAILILAPVVEHRTPNQLVASSGQIENHISFFMNDYHLVFSTIKGQVCLILHLKATQFPQLYENNSKILLNTLCLLSL